jgi:hypothetical protein
MPNAFSGPFIQKTLAGFGVWCCLFFLPNVVQSATRDSATLQWTANIEPDLAGYRIYHGTISGVYGVSQAIGKTTTYQYTNLESNKTHYFTITAFDESGNESLPSPEVSKFIADSSASGSLPLDRSGWNVWVDSEETAGENGRGTNAIDGLPSTFWHTHWSGGVSPPPPHSLVVDLGAVATIEGFRALPRQDGGVNGRIGQYELYVKTNSGTPPTTPTNPDLTVAEWTFVTSGTFPNTAAEQQVLFGAMTSRYVWLKVLSEAQGMNYPWTSLAEFNVLGNVDSGAPPAEDTGTVQDVTPPAISLTSPTNGSTLSGTVNIAATATDNIGVVGVQFQLNGTNLGPEETTTPFSLSWDTTGVAPGPYTLSAIARDAAGNTTSSAPLTVSISSPPSTLTVSVAGSGSVTSSPNGMLCTSGTCSVSYETGRTVTLIANASKRWRFAGWSGACSGTGECVVQLSGDQFVGATFSKGGNGAGKGKGWKK